jgi:excisionase family DNA binding protein
MEKPTDIDTDVLTSSQAALMLNVSRTTVNKLADRGLLKSWRVPGGKHRRFVRRDVLNLAEECGIAMK